MNAWAWESAAHSFSLRVLPFVNAMSRAATPRQRLAICIRNDDYPASLEKGKVYRVLPDAVAARRGYLRVIDESGEDYLYPNDYFVPIRLPPSVEKTVVSSLSPVAS
jgi:hypothetical protein